MDEDHLHTAGFRIPLEEAEARNLQTGLNVADVVLVGPGDAGHIPLGQSLCHPLHAATSNQRIKVIVHYASSAFCYNASWRVCIRSRLQSTIGTMSDQASGQKTVVPSCRTLGIDGYVDDIAHNWSIRKKPGSVSRYHRCPDHPLDTANQVQPSRGNE